MIGNTRNNLARQLLRKLIGIATETLYSEQFDFHPLVQRLSRNGQELGLLRAYVAISIAAQLAEPLTDDDVDRGVIMLTELESHSHSTSFSEILEVHKEIAAHFWSCAHLSILRGKLAHQRNECSFDGGLYELQRSKKGPASKAERERLEPICREMEDLNRQIEQAELKAWKEQDEEEYQRYKEDLEARDLRAELDAHEDEELALQSAELYLMLRSRLDSLLHPKQ